METIVSNGRATHTTQDEFNHMLLIEIRRQNRTLAAIKGWVTFFGVLSVIGLAFSLVFLFSAAAAF